MFGIYRKKIIILIFTCLVSNLVHGQKDYKYQMDDDAKKVQWGFYFGLAATNYNVKHNQAYLAPINTPAIAGNKQIFAITSPTTTAIKAGAVVNIYLNERFDLRFSPLSLAIYNRKLLINDSLIIDQPDKAWYELPISIRYKSLRRNNTRMAIFAGLKYGRETNVVIRKKGATTDYLNTNKNSDLCIEYGMSLELFQEYFKFSPEIHFSHGFKNLATYTIPGTNPIGYIDKLRTHSVSLILVFKN